MDFQAAFLFAGGLITLVVFILVLYFLNKQTGILNQILSFLKRDYESGGTEIKLGGGV